MELEKSNEVVDYYPTISAQETKQTNKQNNLLTLTVSCKKSCQIRRKKWINNNNNNNKIKRKEKKKKRLKNW